MRKDRLLISLATLCLGLSAAPLHAQAKDDTPPIGTRDQLLSGVSLTGQPATYALATAPELVTGYGAARFGMTPDQVRAAARTDFGAAAGRLQPEKVEQGFTALAMDIGNTPIGPARISYVFNASGRLGVVNLVRTVPGNAVPAQRQALIDAAAAAAADFRGHSWKLFSTTVGKPFDSNNLLVFGAADDLGNGPEIWLLGVDYSVTLADGSQRRSPPAHGPASLRIAYVADIDSLNVIHPEDFAPAAVTAGYEIPGFRSAQFGMSEDALRAAIIHDLGVKDADIQASTSPAEGTRVLQVLMQRLNPGPCPATVTYILGATSHRLIQVNVSWHIFGDADDAQRQSIVLAGERLKTYFLSRPAQPANFSQDQGLGANAAQLYAAGDSQGHTVQITVEGVPVRPAGESAAAAAVSGPAALRISYVADPVHPDTRH